MMLTPAARPCTPRTVPPLLRESTRRLRGWVGWVGVQQTYRGEDLLHRAGQAVDAEGGAEARVVVPHVHDHKGRAPGVPLLLLLGDLPAVAPRGLWVLGAGGHGEAAVGDLGGGDRRPAEQGRSREQQAARHGGGPPCYTAL